MNLLIRSLEKIKSIRNFTLKQQIICVLTIFVISLLGFLTYDVYRIKKIVYSNQSITSTTAPSISPTSIAPTENLDNIANKPGKVCTYKDVLTPVVSEPEKDDKIQDAIKYQNNKVGLYIYAEVEDFTNIAAEMINSNGGEWGYVLVPYNVKDTNDERWGKLFDRLKNAKLIPIVQLHDIDLEKNKADEQTKDAAKFLNSLKWPIKNRYISAYNEMNDQSFWKGEIDPEGYAKILDDTIKSFKRANPDFFILNGAFNSSARTGPGHLDIRDYMARMNKEVPGIFKRLDGWASHPYPQPNFTGSPNASGRDSIRSYKWELSILKDVYDVNTDKFPVFITETGWPHKQAKEPRNDYLDEKKVADYIKTAYEKVWLPDKNVVAVTPFTIRYNPPHDNFSWIDENNKPYPQYDAVKDIKKIKGKPPVVDYVSNKVLECTYQ